MSDEDILFLEKIPGHAIPVDDDAKRIFDSFNIGQKFEVVPWSGRNYAFHKKLFSLLCLVTNRNPNWKAAHFLLKVIQNDIGSVDVGRDVETGRIIQFPKSIAFKNMSQPAFNKLYSDIADYMLYHLNILLPGMKENEFNSYVQRILDYV